ncbi:metal ABC transporter permease [Corynebacterium accolens]|uniref:metal ABC transporter permease n=1 Tax=Corynebacterium accolens TaxID=38284 RepID=UPI00254FBA20|nr:metal ABC transporter permease [Corynebacterium accolens]MDK8680268.1 metal ABC transporter permease [Corynebacterium accolens]
MGVLTLPFLEAIAVGCLSGLVGTLMVLGNRVFFAESLSHGTFPGAVLGVVVANALGANLSDGLMLGSVAVCIPLAVFMHYLGKVHGVSSTAAAGTTLTLGFALGILLLRWFQPLPLHVDSFLVGSLTTVNHRDVAVAAGLVIICLLAVLACRRRLFQAYFDPSTSPHSGLYDALTLGLICLTMAAVIPAVGTILSIALLVAPAAGLRPWVSRPEALLIGAGIIGITIAVAGLFIAAHLSLSAGGTIAIVAGVFYLASMTAYKAVS